MNQWLDRLDRKMGRCYIEGLMKYICFGMLGVYILEMLPFRTGAVMQLLSFDRDRILSGEVWRLISFVFLPPNSSILFILFALYFYYLIGTTLENRWGSRRFNLYYLIGILGSILGGFLFGYNTNTFLNLSLFLAFAMLYPDFEILLFFILPVKMKYIALLDAALILYQFIVGSLAEKGLILLSMLPLFLFFYRDMYLGCKRGIRRLQMLWQRKRYR